MSKLKIQIIFASTREGRKGEVVANWVRSEIASREDFETEFIDLRDWPLPMFNNPNLPSTGKYPPEILPWANKISEADGFIIVTPEYNHGYPAVLKNAIDQLYKEWNFKPVAFVSYGGASGGARAVEQVRDVIVELQMVSTRDSVHLPFFTSYFDENGKMNNPQIANKLKMMFDQLSLWAKLLKPAR